MSVYSFDYEDEGSTPLLDEEFDFQVNYTLTPSEQVEIDPASSWDDRAIDDSQHMGKQLSLFLAFEKR